MLGLLLVLAEIVTPGETLSAGFHRGTSRRHGKAIARRAREAVFSLLVNTSLAPRKAKP
jgi:hypothetical protein